MTSLTDVIGPSEPHISKLTCKDDSSIIVEWERPQKVFHSLDFYFVSFECEELNQFQVLTLDGSTKAFKERKVIGPLG